MDYAEEVLEHNGVKGMKWGVRKDRKSPHSVSASAKAKVNDTKNAIKKDLAERSSTETTVRVKPGKMVRVVGGVKRAPHEDAIKARTAEQIAKKSTLDSLSNQDLQSLVTRMNLEAQYRNLAVKETRKSPGEKFVGDLLGSDNADLVVGKALGKHATVGKKVIDQAFKTVTSNKGLAGGITKKDKNGSD